LKKFFNFAVNQKEKIIASLALDGDLLALTELQPYQFAA